MDVFELDHVIAKRSKLNKPYLEFLHVPSLSAGLYVLPAAAVDTQEPHKADEVYYIIFLTLSAFRNSAHVIARL